MSEDLKQVPESDLIALKESHTKEIGELTTSHESALETIKGEHGTAVTELNSKARTANEELSRLRAANTQLEEATKGHASTAEDMETLKSELKESKKSSDSAMESLAATYREQLQAEPFGIPEDVLKDKTVAQLRDLREILLATRSPNSNNYTASGGGGSTQKMKPREMIAKGLEAGELSKQ